MHINTVPARTRFDSLKPGFKSFWRQPRAWLLLSCFAYSALLVFMPWRGQALNWALAPLVWLLMMAAATHVNADQPLRLATLPMEMTHIGHQATVMVNMASGDAGQSEEDDGEDVDDLDSPESWESLDPKIKEFIEGFESVSVEELEELVKAMDAKFSAPRDK